LRLKTEAESNPVVTAAFILAWAEYNRQINAFLQKAEVTLTSARVEAPLHESRRSSKILFMAV
jgi:hypothetical protein